LLFAQAGLDLTDLLYASDISGVTGTWYCVLFFFPVEMGGSHKYFFWSWPGIMILPILAFQVTWMTGKSHQRLVYQKFLKHGFWRAIIIFLQIEPNMKINTGSQLLK
jgi:hypothetical protein